MKPFFRIKIVIDSTKYDQAITLCNTLGMAGLEERAVGGTIALDIYFKDEAGADSAARPLRETLRPESLSIERVEPEDWNAKWRESMRSACLTRGYWVSPLWLPPPPTARHWIKIEPKMAFGTGHHETTRLAAAMIIRCKRQVAGKRVIDIGSGSGVLGFTAGICGAASCTGVEIDPDCAENMAENRANNAGKGRILFLIGTIDAFRPRPCFDVAVMNMLITESVPVLSPLANLLTPRAMLIWSGILGGEREEALSAASTAGFALAAEKQEREWWCGAFRLMGNHSKI